MKIANTFPWAVIKTLTKMAFILGSSDTKLVPTFHNLLDFLIRLDSPKPEEDDNLLHIQKGRCWGSKQL